MGRRRGHGWQGTITCPVCDEAISYTAWYDPGYTSGPPEDCYPPEGDCDVEFHEGCSLTNEQESAILDAAMDKDGEIEDEGPDPDDYRDDFICDRYYDGH